MKLFTVLQLVFFIATANAADESPQGSFTLFVEEGTIISHYGCLLNEDNKSKLRCDVQDVYISKGKGEDFSQVRSNPEFQAMFDEGGNLRGEFAGQFQEMLDETCPLVPYLMMLTDSSEVDVDSLLRDIREAYPTDIDEETQRTAINKFIGKSQAEKDYNITMFNQFSEFCDGSGADADLVLKMLEIENKKKKKTCQFTFKQYAQDFEKVNDDLWITHERRRPLFGCEVIAVTRLFRNREKEVYMPVWEMDYQQIPLDEEAEDSLGGSCKDRMGVKDVYLSQWGLNQPLYLGCEFIH
jgi:hypothetical protein